MSTREMVVEVLLETLTEGFGLTHYRPCMGPCHPSLEALHVSHRWMEAEVERVLHLFFGSFLILITLVTVIGKSVEERSA